jgi:iron complex outermembrane recepter protein
MYISKKTARRGVSAVALVLGVGLAFGAQAQDTEIIVTGTRTTGLKAVDSPAPITVLDSALLKRTGQPDLIQALSQNVPSFNAQAFGGDTAALTLSAKLRGVSPNHALVLINGKRRHGTANLAVLGGAFQGGASADLNFIPLASVDRVEVLLEGAAAQYGTDAIAGVINIIQKKAGHGGEVSLSSGQYFDGGGRTGDLTANFGFAPTDKSYLNITGETKYHGYSFRGDKDPRTIDTAYNVGATNSPAKSYPQIVNAPGYPYLNRIPGDAEYRLNTVSYNAGYEVSPELEIYSFGTYGEKTASAFENYRLPNVVTGKMATDIPFPLGFKPREASEEVDYAATVGTSGVFAGWNFDLSSTYGEDSVIIKVLDTANADLYKDTSTTTTKGTSPNNVIAGTFTNTQWTTTFDLTHSFDVGLAGPLNFATGVEYREETYGIKAGDPASYYKGGSQSFAGFAPVNAGTHGRNNKAIYFDFAVDPITGLQLDAALRYEKFSDFGDTTVAKLTGRYDFSPAFALRATVSSGFRAPTLAEEYYSGINVGPSSISGQLAPNSVGAALIGLDGLKPEKSKNYSLGFVAHPVSGLTVTLDAYQIDIEDRIVGSGTFYAAHSSPSIITSPAVTAALAANGVNIDPTIFTNTSYSIGASAFVNGLATTTKGVDLVATYPTDFGKYGKVSWTVTGSYNTTEVTSISPPPSKLAAGVSLFDVIAISNIEDTAPKYRFNVGGLWSLGKWSVSLKEAFYGESKTLSFDSFAPSAYRYTTIEPAAITDLNVTYRITKSVKLDVGANNLFNVYPDKIDATLRQHQLQQNSNGYVTLYPTISPFGINGGYYYSKLSYSF